VIDLSYPVFLSWPSNGPRVLTHLALSAKQAELGLDESNSWEASTKQHTKIRIDCQHMNDSFKIPVIYFLKMIFLKTLLKTISYILSDI
jgi:hypothetical protein